MFNNQYNNYLRNGARARVLGTCLEKNRYKTKNEVLKFVVFAGSSLGAGTLEFFLESGTGPLLKLGKFWKVWVIFAREHF